MTDTTILNKENKLNRSSNEIHRLNRLKDLTIRQYLDIYKSKSTCHDLNFIISNNKNHCIDFQYQGMNAVTYASLKGCSKSVIQKLTLSSFDHKQVDRNGRTPLHYASYYCSTKTILHLIYKKLKIASKDYYNKTPLHFSCETGNLKTSKILIEECGYINNKDSCGYTPLNFAAEGGYQNLVNFLIMKGTKIKPNDLSIINASRNGYSDIVKYLLKYGANTESKTEMGGETALIEACRYGKTNVVQILLNNGANIEATTNCGDTSLTYARLIGRKDIEELLINYLSISK